MKTKTLQNLGYYVNGTARILLWDGSEGEVYFTPFTISKENLDIKDIIMAIDDGNVGCQKLLSADVVVYDLYENNVTEFRAEFYFDTDELNKYNFCNNNQYIKETYGVSYPNEIDFIEYEEY